MLKKRYFKTKDECEVTFELGAENAREAAVVCEANGWEPVAMSRTGKGPFRTRLRLPKNGEFEFRYLIDNDHWVNDESADLYRTNEFGTENGVVKTLQS
jgi:1,4-alpha-glucan branching enzyme